MRTARCVPSSTLQESHATSNGTGLSRIHQRSGQAGHDALVTMAKHRSPVSERIRDTRADSSTRIVPGSASGSGGRASSCSCSPDVCGLVAVVGSVMAYGRLICSLQAFPKSRFPVSRILKKYGKSGIFPEPISGHFGNSGKFWVS